MTTYPPSSDDQTAVDTTKAATNTPDQILDAVLQRLGKRAHAGLLGLLIGDALGVPYEFKTPADIPPLHQIHPAPPAGYRRSHPDVAPGTWSDDGAQALCLAQSLFVCGSFDAKDFARRMLHWLDQGHLAVDGIVFDVGLQTHKALQRIAQGAPALSAGGASLWDNGNGSLMRVLPLALWHDGPDIELVRDAHLQSLPTHAHELSQVCCALYCLLARALLRGQPASADAAAQQLGTLYRSPHWPMLRDAEPALASSADALAQLQTIVTSSHRAQPGGSGFVLDSLWSAWRCFEQGHDYADVVRRAVALGHDTDTTACIAGGLAGLKFGLDGIPPVWRQDLRGLANPSR